MTTLFFVGFDSSALLDGRTGWLVSVSNNGKTFSEARLYLPYDELCYQCTVYDDVRDVTAKTGDVTLPTVVCTRTVLSHLCSFVSLFVRDLSECFTDI